MPVETRLGGVDVGEMESGEGEQLVHQVGAGHGDVSEHGKGDIVARVVRHGGQVEVTVGSVVKEF